MAAIREFLQERRANDRPILMDGGTGTEILRRGVETKLPLWSADALRTHPDVVREIHRDYIGAGAEVLITNTFRTQRRTLEKAGKGEHARDLTVRAAQLAREAIIEADVERRVWIAGSVAPLEECYTPELVPELSIAKIEHREHIAHLLAGGVDFILVETMNSIGEAVVALEAAQELGAALAVSFCVTEEATLLDGDSLENMVAAVEPLGPLALMVNCSQPDATTKALAKLAALTEIPLGAYANGHGHPAGDDGWRFEGGVPVDGYLAYIDDWREAGALLVGGCCGTSPEYIAAMHGRLYDGTAV